MADAVTSADHLRARLPAFRRRLASARETVSVALAAGARSYVAFSGGKDSLVTLALVAEQRPGITAIWSDDELEHAAQPEYIRRVCGVLGVSLVVTLGVTEHAGWFRPWCSEPYWREPLREASRIWVTVDAHMAGAGYGLSFLGLRAEESWHRRMNARRGSIYEIASGLLRCQPLVGWSVDDVWAAIACLGLEPNPVYDRMAEVGVPRQDQRVGPLPLSNEGVLRACWPDLYGRLVERYGNRWS